MIAEIIISLTDQRLYGLDDQQQVIVQYSISSAECGPGQLANSGCTPVGQHRARAKIGGDQPTGTVFVGRRPTGEIYSESLAQEYPQRDWILTRIIWLQGLEPGYNRGHGVDTMQRYIYIHGTPETEPLGIPKSHGCIRMHSEDVIDLYDRILINCPVLIQVPPFNEMKFGH